MTGTNIVVTSRVGKSNNTQRTSVKGTKATVREAKDNKENRLAFDRKMKDMNKALNVTSSAITNAHKGRAGLSLSKSMGFGVKTMVLMKVLEIANKSADFGIDIVQAKSGNELYYGNVKQVKNTIMSLGTNVVYGTIRNEFITKRIVERQNNALEYGNKLYNLNNYGEKFKTR